MKNIIVGQSGGPTAVINASLLGVFKAGKDLKADRIYGMVYGIEGLLEKDVVDLSTQITCLDDMDLLRRTPSSFLGSCRYKLPEPVLGNEIFERIFQVLKELEIFAFFYIGGNDSMDTIKKLSIYGALVDSPISFVGVPKTIDNDLAITDHTPGYGSACKYIATTLKELVRDGLVYRKPVISVVEVMGRDAGWLTASACLVKGEDCEGVEMILLPEIPLDINHFLARVGKIVEQNRSAVIAVSEGVKVADGRYVCELADMGTQKDPFGHTRLAGTSRYLAHLITKTFGCRTKSMELSFMQRCASHFTAFRDAVEAEQLGYTAVQLAFQGKNGIVTTIKRIANSPYEYKIEYADVHHIANAVKQIPLEWIDVENYTVKQPMFDYLQPICDGFLQPMWENSLPKHLILKR